MTLDERVHAVIGLNFTERQARFLVTVALQGGYCLRRQYETFAGIGYGKNVRGFFDELVRRGVADRFAGRADRGHLYHLQSRALYRAIGEPHNRNRRSASAAQIARRLMVLDAVLARPDVEWVATERDKVALFVERFSVPTAALPTQPFGTIGGEQTARHFVEKLPIFVGGATATPHFLYLAVDGSADAFTAFLHAHATLLRCLPIWTVIVASVTPVPSLRPVFERFSASLAATLVTDRDDLRWYFEQRPAIDSGELTHLSVFDLRRYRELHQRFTSPAHDTLYAEWRATGQIGEAHPGSPTGDSTGTLITQRLPFTYEQFGSLPGVA